MCISISLGLEVIILKFILKLKIKHNDWLLADTPQPIIALYLESENELKFYNLEAWSHFSWFIYQDNQLHN